jgi:hypothetical protein
MQKTAQQLDHDLKSALQKMEENKKHALFCFEEIIDRKLYRDLGYSSIYLYAKTELGFSDSRTGDYLNLCRRLKKLPAVKAQIASGQLGYTHARTLLPVIDETNQDQWLDLAKNKSRRELANDVKLARTRAAAVKTRQQPLLPEPQKLPPVVVPVQVTLQMSPSQFARYEALWEKLNKLGNVPTEKVEALLEVMAGYATQSATRVAVSPPAQIHIHQCPDCEKSIVQTSKGELVLDNTELEKAECDCQSSVSGERNKSAIPPALRRQILAKYRHKCQRPGCGHTRYLEIHHKIYRSRGGTNDPSNLTCLCSACHALAHQKPGFQVKELRADYMWSADKEKGASAEAPF